MGNMANTNTWVVYAILFMVSLVAAQLLLGMGKVTGNAKRPAGKAASSASFRWTLVKLALMMLLVVVLIYGGSCFYYYAPLRGEVLAARLTFIKQSTQAGVYWIEHTPYEGKQPGTSREYALKGERFVVDAEWLQWGGVLAKGGFPQMFRLTHLRGYDPYEKEAGEQRLAGGTTNSLWQIIQRINGVLGLTVVTIVRSEPFMPADGEGVEIYISKAGVRIGTASQPSSSIQSPSERPAVAPSVRYPRTPEAYRH